MISKRLTLLAVAVGLSFMFVKDINAYPQQILNGNFTNVTTSTAFPVCYYFHSGAGTQANPLNITNLPFADNWFTDTGIIDFQYNFVFNLTQILTNPNPLYYATSVVNDTPFNDSNGSQAMLLWTDETGGLFPDKFNGYSLAGTNQSLTCSGTSPSNFSAAGHIWQPVTLKDGFFRIGFFAKTNTNGVVSPFKINSSSDNESFTNATGFSDLVVDIFRLSDHKLLAGVNILNLNSSWQHFNPFSINSTDILPNTPAAIVIRNTGGIPTEITDIAIDYLNISSACTNICEGSTEHQAVFDPALNTCYFVDVPGSGACQPPQGPFVPIINTTGNQFLGPISFFFTKFFISTLFLTFLIFSPYLMLSVRKAKAKVSPVISVGIATLMIGRFIAIGIYPLIFGLIFFAISGLAAAFFLSKSIGGE